MWFVIFLNVCKPTHFVCILQVVIVDLLYGLEVDDSFHLGLVFVCSRERKRSLIFATAPHILTQPTRAASTAARGPLTCVIGEGPAVMVKDEPALLPRLDLATHLDEEAPTGFISDGQMEAGVWVVSGRLDVAVEIDVVFPRWEVAA